MEYGFPQEAMLMMSARNGYVTMVHEHGESRLDNLVLDLTL